MKPAIGYAVVRQLYSGGYEPLALTTVKARMVYGRRVADESPRSVAMRDVLARTATLDDALKAIEAAARVDAETRGEIEATRTKLHRLTAERAACMDDAIKAYRAA
jgi:hypothetical protein